MSTLGPKYRSFKRILPSDLRRLCAIAIADRKEFFRKYSKWRIYRNRVLCIALCQGAASHFIDGRTGINDFDVYTFYREHPTVRWYAKRIGRHDFGDPKFGRSKDRQSFIGRRVDVLGRAIKVLAGERPRAALLRYLRERRTKTAQCLSEKAVVFLQPQCGTILWRPKGHSAHT